MLIGALGCNLAWGIIDAVMYLVSLLAERGRGLALLRRVRRTTNPETAHQIISESLPPVLASVLTPQDLDSLRERLRQVPDPAERSRLTGRDFIGAAAVCLLVFFSTMPVIVPFIILHDAPRALRISNGIAVAMMFLCGWRLGRYGGRRPWLMGIGMALIGSVLVAITIALGG